MKTNNTIYSFFIALALLFWNPISFFLIYVNIPNPVFTEKVNFVFYLIYSVVFLSGVLFIVLIQKDKFSEKIKNIILTVTFTGLFFSTLFIFDKLVGLLKKDVTHVYKRGGLIFEPNTNAKYQTVEFEYVANINSLGLRDREIQEEKGDKYRILCFGDSWTYGWGVNVKDSWPRKLEQYLLTNGFKNIEVINCGQPGQYTTRYKTIMNKVIPALKPDMVLVGVLQCDDLEQLYLNNLNIQQTDKNSSTQKFTASRFKSLIITYLEFSFKNSLSLLSNKDIKSGSLKSNWKTAATSKIESFDNSQDFIFQTLKDTAQNMFLSGNLNPYLLNFYIELYDSRRIFNTPHHPATEYAIHEMNKDFKAMKTLCDKYNSDLIFINLPTPGFTGHIVVRTPIEDAQNAHLQKNNKVDSIYHSVAIASGVPYIELTDYFIGLQNKSAYFFRFDGHPNERGHEEMAKYIGKQLTDKGMIEKK